MNFPLGSKMSGLTCLVTGGLGYIGSHVVAELVERGHKCDVIDCSPTGENLDFVEARANHLWRE